MGTQHKVNSFSTDEIAWQRSKLTMHTAPDVHISEAGCTFFYVWALCVHIFSLNSHCNILEKCTGKYPRRTVSICVHPRGAQNKTLISNTAWFWNSSIAGHLMLNGLMGSDQQTDRAGAE